MATQPIPTRPLARLLVGENVGRPTGGQKQSKMHKIENAGYEELGEKQRETPDGRKTQQPTPGFSFLC